MSKNKYEPIIKKFKETIPVEQDEGVKFHNLLLQDMEPKTLMVGTATFEPNKGLPCHTHNVEETVTILKGKAYCFIEDEKIYVEEYDTSFIPANIPHRFVNASDSEELVILWVYSQVDASFNPVQFERNIVEPGKCGKSN